MTKHPAIKFDDAKREQCKASIMIEGLPGSGKTGLALLIGKVLAEEWDKVFHIDTENRSGLLFADTPSTLEEDFGKFKSGQLGEEIGFSPTNYLAFRQVAKDAGAKVVIKDSISHAWMHKGGVLDLLTIAKAKNSRFAKDAYAAWSDEDVMREKTNLIELIRDKDVHIITTVRVKEKMEYDTDDKGKAIIKSLGDQQIQQADLKYEPDLVLHMISPGELTEFGPLHPKVKVIKSRYPMFKKDYVYEMSLTVIKQIKAYLEEGADPKELEEELRQEYITGIKELLDAKPGLKMVWQVSKKDAGHEKTKLEDMPLALIKQLFLKLTN